MTDTSGVMFVNASYPAGIVDKFAQIRALVANRIPKATTWRVWKLALQKASMALTLSADDQYRVFYTLLPKLPSPNDVDLYANRGLRQEVAKILAEL